MWQPIPPQMVTVAVELALVQERLDGMVSPVARELLDRFLPETSGELLIPAAFVLMCGRPGRNTHDIILPALLFTLIQLGTTLHQLTPDSDSARRELLILLGDYYYSYLFQLLCTSDTLFLLERIARLICVINEGQVLLDEVRVKISEQKTENIIVSLQKRYGMLMAEGCAIGSLLGGGATEVQAALYSFGFEFGIAWGAMKQRLDSSWVVQPLQQALEGISSLPDDYLRTELASMAQQIISTPDLIVSVS